MIFVFCDELKSKRTSQQHKCPFTAILILSVFCGESKVEKTFCFVMIWGKNAKRCVCYVSCHSDF